MPRVGRYGRQPASARRGCGPMPSPRQKITAMLPRRSRAKRSWSRRWFSDRGAQPGVVVGRRAAREGWSTSRAPGRGARIPGPRLRLGIRALCQHLSPMPAGLFCQRRRQAPYDLGPREGEQRSRGGLLLEDVPSRAEHDRGRPHASGVTFSHEVESDLLIVGTADGRCGAEGTPAVYGTGERSSPVRATDAGGVIRGRGTRHREHLEIPEYECRVRPGSAAAGEPGSRGCDCVRSR